MTLGELVSLLIEPKRIAREIRRRAPGTFGQKLRWDAVPRPPYAYGTYYAAHLARALGMDRMSVIEFGVGQGKGLLALEGIASEVSAEVGVGIDVYGFDSGAGLPPPVDYRDLPNRWRAGLHKMDVERLKRELKQATLVLGDVSESVLTFADTHRPSPVGFIAFDLDFYSSTMEAFKLFDSSPELLLPRVFCYFDNCIGSDWSLHSEHTGELLAIHDFNEKHADRKLAKIHGLPYKRRIPSAWNEKMFVLHSFRHPLYTKHVYPKST